MPDTHRRVILLRFDQVQKQERTFFQDEKNIGEFSLSLFFEVFRY